MSSLYEEYDDIKDSDLACELKRRATGSWATCATDLHWDNEAKQIIRWREGRSWAKAVLARRIITIDREKETCVISSEKGLVLVLIQPNERSMFVAEEITESPCRFTFWNSFENALKAFKVDLTDPGSASMI